MSNVKPLEAKARMSKRPPTPYLGAVALFVALVVVVNPELRAFLLLADYLGLEMLGLIFALQLRSHLAAALQLAQSCKRCLQAARGSPLLFIRVVSGLLCTGPFTFPLAIAAPLSMLGNCTAAREGYLANQRALL
jgi:hypothetical protein